MRLKTGITKKEIVVFLVCLIFLMINVGAISSEGRRLAKRAVCLANLKQLTLAWTQFANDNDGFIVNGAAGIFQPNEPPWVNKDWNDPYGSGHIIPKDFREKAIKEGALWPYCRELKLYHCPNGYPFELRNYSIVDGMNGSPRNGTIEGIHWIKKMEQIRRPARRAVFIDEGWITPDSFAVVFNQEVWWDDPPVRHGDGTTLSFADGHSVWHRWKGRWTVAYGLATIGTHPQNLYPPGTPLPDGTIVPATSADYEDLYWLQRVCWGELGYTPH